MIFEEKIEKKKLATPKNVVKLRRILGRYLSIECSVRQTHKLKIDSSLTHMKHTSDGQQINKIAITKEMFSENKENVHMMGH